MRARIPAARAGDVRDSQASLERIRKKLNYQPNVDFDEGLRLSLQLSRNWLLFRQQSPGPRQRSPGP